MSLLSASRPRLSKPLLAVAVIAACVSGAVVGRLPSAGASRRTQGDWSKFQFDLGNTGFNRFETVLDRGNVGDLAEAWAQGLRNSSPVVVNGVVYQGAQAFRASDGGLLWDDSAQIGVLSSVPAVSHGVVYVGSDYPAAGLYAIDAHTGNIKWRGPTQEIYSSSPLVKSGLVYVMDSRGTLYAFPTSCSDPCSPRWSEDLGREERSPAYADGVLYAASNGVVLNQGTLYALDPATGEIEWTATTPGKIGPSPTVVNAVVYIAYDNPAPFTIVAYPATCATPCQPLWSIGVKAIVHYLAVAKGILYASLGHHYLFAYDRLTGSELWEANTGTWNGGTSFAPAVANGVVYELGTDGALHAFNSRTGKELLNLPFGRCCIATGVAVSQGTVYLSGPIALRLPPG